MAQAFDICIRGAGIVGSTLALLLARERLRVALVSSTAAPAPDKSDVRAYALNATSRGMLDALRCWPEPALATAVQAMRICGDDGGEVNFSAAEQGAEALAWIVDVQALQARLSDAVRYQPLIEPLPAPPQEATLTVVCEGKASATRADLGVDYDVTPYHQHAIATRLTCEKPHGQVARQWFGPDGSILAFLPLDGVQGNSVAVVWSVDEAQAPQLLALDAKDLANRLEQASHQCMGQLEVICERAAWPLQLATASRWVGSFSSATPARAWALAGDAAHTVHPLAGQGLNLGLADAAGLAQVLREREYWRSVGDAKLLRRYERSRKASLLALAGATDGLQRLFARSDAATQNLRNWGMKGFERSGLLKSWVARQAMGL
ncbi:MAG TPA: FAD-dependent monooxygenase [Burkholderiaceae bacterium]|nr:FAD-dependent monooxygenase [Burkholderiaceae bacterium]